jgi:ribosome maturation factor RimP
MRLAFLPFSRTCCVSCQKRYNKTWSVEPIEWAKAHFFVGFERMREMLASKLEEIARRVAESEGMELVEVQVLGGGKSRLVRIAIDKPAGISHADCELISHQVSAILDVEDLIPGHYTLEVSSPGVERKLLKPNDYQRFEGKKARVALREPVENQRHWEGTLAGFDQGVISLESSPGKVIRFRYDQVEKASLKFEW